jgi:hypothetical protein
MIDNSRCGSIVIVSNMPYFLKVTLYVHFCFILFSILLPHIGPFQWPLMTNVEQLRDYEWWRETEVLGGKPAPVSVRPLEIQYRFFFLLAR